ncbi:MAG: hypothetical protein M1828_006944 [Chrysothrix sp. TS-e1954]|nr:MAG: hypothetical protein M1828_006944 [Chrysothrix sp. TS-e1954]
MWLDRFSTSATPASSVPQSRNLSPAPRRSLSVTPQRPGLNPRSTSLSLLSNSSSQNLPLNPRQSQRSGLRNQIEEPPPSDIESPLTLVGRLLGFDLAEEAGKPVAEHESELPTERPDEVDEEIDFGGRSLYDFAYGDIEVPGGALDVPEYSRQSVEEYERSRDRFEELHKSIASCDDVLKSVENYLTSFQNDLSAVSAEIETLQSRSTTLNARLETRKKVEKRLAPVVEKITISPSIVRKIVDGQIDDTWVKALEELKSKLDDSQPQKSDSHMHNAQKDLKPLLEDLATVAVERIRDHFSNSIKALRSPNINAQMVQERDFLRKSSLFRFLAVREPQLASDMAQAYTNTMRWYYTTLFTRYHQALLRLKIHSNVRPDMLGEDPSVPRNTSKSTTSTYPSHDSFTLARRLDTIRVPTTSALSASTAEDAKAPTNVETPFLSFNLALLDNASFEYGFLSSFLPTTLSSHSNLSQYTNSMFNSVFETGYLLTRSLVAESYDALGILLMIRLSQHFAFILQRRKIPTLDTYVNGTSMMLWPRFQSVMDAHCDSLKKLTASLPSRPGGNTALASLTGASSTSNAQGNSVSTAPHPITQRFANFLHGLLALSSEAREDEPITTSLTRLRGEFESFLSRKGASFGAGEKGKRERQRFLANNYSLVLTILGDVKGKLADNCRERFNESLSSHDTA